MLSNRCFQLGLINSELYRLGGWSGTKIVHASLEAPLPSIEVHRSKFGSIRLSNEGIERLGLIDECNTRKYVKLEKFGENKENTKQKGFGGRGV